MKAYAAIASRQFQDALQYRGNYVLGMLSGLALVLAMFFFWRAGFEGRASIAGYGWAQTKTYLLIGYLAGNLVAFSAEARLSSRIRRGSIACDLLLPVDFQGARLCETLGDVAAQGLPALVVTVAVGIAFAGVLPPSGPAAAAGAAIALLLGVVLKSAIVYAAALLCFWTTNFVGISWARAALTNLLSGALIPLSFFPAGVAAALRWLPFAGITDTPARIYLGQLTGPGAVGAVALEAAWTVVLLLVGRGIWRAATAELNVHGG
jgi:ABC-2 type transport system permease protein